MVIETATVIYGVGFGAAALLHMYPGVAQQKGWRFYRWVDNPTSWARVAAFLVLIAAPIGAFWAGTWLSPIGALIGGWLFAELLLCTLRALSPWVALLFMVGAWYLGIQIAFQA